MAIVVSGCGSYWNFLSCLLGYNVSYAVVLISLMLCFSQAPCVGVSSYVSMLPNSETTLGHTLLPLPPYFTTRHPQVQLDPQVGDTEWIKLSVFPEQKQPACLQKPNSWIPNVIAHAVFNRQFLGICNQLLVWFFCAGCNSRSDALEAVPLTLPGVPRRREETQHCLEAKMVRLPGQA